MPLIPFTGPNPCVSRRAGKPLGQKCLFGAQGDAKSQVALDFFQGHLRISNPYCQHLERRVYESNRN